MFAREAVSEQRLVGLLDIPIAGERALGGAVWRQLQRQSGAAEEIALIVVMGRHGIEIKLQVCGLCGQYAVDDLAGGDRLVSGFVPHGQAGLRHGRALDVEGCRIWA